MKTETTPEGELSPPDFSRLKISSGVIHYGLYRQDGTMQAMEASDTLDNRHYISWIQQFDRYTDHGANQ